LYKLIVAFALILFSCKEEQKTSELTSKANIEFRLAEEAPGENLTEYSFRDFNKKFYLHPEVLCNNDDFLNVNVIEWNDEYAIEVEFTESGRARWADITGNNIGKHIAILVNDELVTCPVIRAKIDQGLAIINGGFSEKEAEDLVKYLLLNTSEN